MSALSTPPLPTPARTTLRRRTQRLDKLLKLPAIAAGAILVASCGGGGGGGNDGHDKPLAAPVDSRWSALYKLPMVPAAAANLPDGKLLLWAAEDRFNFLTKGVRGQTYTSVFDPAAGTATDVLVSNTDHDMFCPGSTNLPDGRLLVNGGIDADRTSLYDPSTGRWTTAARMSVPRGYQSNALLQDGSVLTIGGSWAPGAQNGRKFAEIWTEADGWRLLRGLDSDAMSTDDVAGPFRADNHMWLIPTATGAVLKAGPSRQMHWIDTAGRGSFRSAGRRADDTDSMNGTIVMYEAERVLKSGGSADYSNSEANAASYVIDVADGVEITKVEPMKYRRVFHNSVVLPNGQVLIVGGQTKAIPLSDEGAVLPAELWDPETRAHTVLAPMAAPRVYHSVALLLPDGRVAAAGGGLCGEGCAANHPDLQILTPWYLSNADGSAATRPEITAAPAAVEYGQTLAVEADGEVDKLVLIRLSSTTHTVNNDQRRLVLDDFADRGRGRYEATLPTNRGIALPGDYMLFALDGRGVPSVAKTIRLGSTATPVLVSPGDQAATVGRAVDLDVQATVPRGTAASFSAENLPAGLSIDAAGHVTGRPTAAGRRVATITVTTAKSRVSTRVAWTVKAAG